MKAADLAPAAACPVCPSCGSTALVKSGHNSCGSQQYLCKAGGAHRVLAAKSRTATPERQAQILRAVECERLSLRAAERVFGVSRKSVVQWLKKKPQACRL